MKCSDTKGKKREPKKKGGAGSPDNTDLVSERDIVAYNVSELKESMKRNDMNGRRKGRKEKN